MRSTRLTIAYVVLMIAASAGAHAQPLQTGGSVRPARPFVEHGFITIGAGVQAAADPLADRVQFETNAETGSIDATYPGRSGVLFDATVGVQVRRHIGLAVGVARATRSGAAAVSADIPHPFFDNQPRTVEGDARDVTRSETSIHMQLYYDLRPGRSWRVRLFGGPSYVDVEQELVTEVEARETFPFDAAEFDSATIRKGSGSGIGFNAGLEAARMFSSRIGLGGSIRYVRASIDLSAPGARSVSTDGGGLQAAAGLRFAF